MLLLAILGYRRLFHFKLFLSIVNYFTLNFVDIFKQFYYMTIDGYWWLLVVLLLGLLVVNDYYNIGIYSIDGY
jgi:hypothetical protein